MKKYIFSLSCSLIVMLSVIACSSGKKDTDQTGEQVTSTLHNGKKRYFPPRNETPVSGEIHLTADETFKPIIQNMVRTFENTYQKTKVVVHYMAGEDAIRSMIDNDSIRLTIATRMLSEGEQAELKAQGTSGKPQKLATDAIALVVNQANKDSVFTYDQLKGILSGEIKSWKDINSKSPLGDIQLFFDKPGSSTYQYLRDTLLAGQAPTGYFPDTTNSAIPEGLEGVRAEVINRPGAIGVIGLAWISDSDSQRAVGFKKNLIVCKIENPSAANICLEYGKAYQPYQGLMKLKCYPLNRSVYSISRETRRGLLGGGFINFMTRPETGQRLILKAGLVPAFGVPRIVQFPN